MSDLIDRQAAIDALRYAQHRFTVADEAGGMGTVKWSEDVIYFAAAERVLSELPSAQPQHNVRFSDVDHVWIDGKQYISLQRFGEAIKDAQPEIVKCRDCKHMQEDKIFHQCWCNGNEVKPDHFCGYGVRMRNNKGEWN